MSDKVIIGDNSLLSLSLINDPQSIFLQNSTAS